MLAFQALVASVLRQEGLLDVVETDERIRVALSGADQEALIKEFGKEKVDKANRPWNHVS